MAKKIGDMLTSEIRRAGFSDIKLTIDRGAGPVVVSLIPWSDGTFIEKAIGKRGLDGRFDISYYEQRITIEYLQTDGETMADMFSSALASQWSTTGISTAITMFSGKVITLTFYWELEPHGEGYDSVFAVRMIGISTTTTPVLR